MSSLKNEAPRAKAHGFLNRFQAESRLPTILSGRQDKGYFRLINLIGVFSLILLCLAYQACLAASPSAKASGDSPSKLEKRRRTSGTLKFSISLDKSEYKLDEPINVSFKLENKGKTAVYVNKRFYLGSESMPKEERDVFLVVTSPSGAKLPCRFSYETGFPKSDYFELLKPGAEVVSEYPRNLRGYFDFNESGVYKIIAVYQNVYGEEIGLGTFKEKITSSAVSFKIIKPDSNEGESGNK